MCGTSNGSSTAVSQAGQGVSLSNDVVAENLQLMSSTPKQQDVPTEEKQKTNPFLFVLQDIYEEIKKHLFHQGGEVQRVLAGSKLFLRYLFVLNC